MTMITVYTAFNSADAHLIRSLLEASNIPAVVNNELASLSMEGYSQAAGGIQVDVPEAFAEEARARIENRAPQSE